MNTQKFNIALFANTQNISKEAILMESDKIVESVLEGNQYALETFANISFLEDILAMAKDKIKDACMNEIKNFGKGECLFGNSELSLVNGRKDLVYSEDPICKELEKRMSDRKAFIKLSNQAHHSNSSVVDNETGEIFKPVSEKYGKDYLTFKIKK